MSILTETEVISTIAVTSTTNSRKAMVVLAESNDDSRSYLESYLSEEYIIKSFGDGIEALAYIERNKPDLIMCNMELNGMSGVELSSRLKTSYKTSIIPVILYGTHTANEHRSKRMASLADIFLHMPVDVEELKIEMAVLIKNKRLLWKAFLQVIFGEKFVVTEEAIQTANPNLVDQVKDVVLQMLEGPMNTKIKISDIAQKIGMSQSCLHSKWTSITGSPLKQFVIRIQLEKAREWLESGLFQVRDVQSKLNWDSEKNFRNLYKKYFGITPSQSIGKMKR